MKAQLALAVSILSLSACALAHDREKSHTLAVQPLTTPLDHDGCACTFHAGPSLDTPIYAAWDIAAELPETKLNINGQEHALRLVDESDWSGELPKVGDKATFSFRGPTADSDFSCHVSQTCWEHESCEVIHYTCDISAHSNGLSGNASVVGACGC